MTVPNIMFQDQIWTVCFLQSFPSRDSGGEFIPFLVVSKGKRLFSRLLPFLKHDKALKILRIVTSNLPTLMSRDTEEVRVCVQVQFEMFYNITYVFSQHE